DTRANGRLGKDFVHHVAPLPWARTGRAWPSMASRRSTCASSTTPTSSGCKDRSVKLWDPQTGALRQTLTGPEARIESHACAPDGTILAGGSGGPEALIWLWELRPPRE